MRNRAMLGPGSRKMGGAGIKAGKPPTSMAGSGLGAPKGGAAMAMGAPPMAPKVANVRPPGIGAGAPPPMPGGSGLPPKPAAPPPMGGPPGGMGGSGGFAKGGDVGGDMPQASDFAKGASPSKFNATAGSRGDAIDAAQRELSEGAQHRYAKGGSVGIRMGGDTKPRHKGKSHK